MVGGAVLLFLVVTAANVFNLDYEFNSVKSFPEDLPSRVGFEIVEEKFNKGEFSSNNSISCRRCVNSRTFTRNCRILLRE